VVEAHYMEDAEGHGFYVTAGYSLVSDGRYQVYIHPPAPILAWLVPDRDAADRWIRRRLPELGHSSCSELCHLGEESSRSLLDIEAGPYVSSRTT